MGTRARLAHPRKRSRRATRATVTTIDQTRLEKVRRPSPHRRRRGRSAHLCAWSRRSRPIHSDPPRRAVRGSNPRSGGTSERTPGVTRDVPPALACDAHQTATSATSEHIRRPLPASARLLLRTKAVITPPISHARASSNASVDSPVVQHLQIAGREVAIHAAARRCHRPSHPRETAVAGFKMPVPSWMQGWPAGR
jgi:hypothetical protein